MPELPPPAVPVVFLLRVVLSGVSPLIWRRILVRSDTTIADLNAILESGTKCGRSPDQGVTPGVPTPELNEAVARKSSNPANPRTGQHGSANSCLPRFVPLSAHTGTSISGLETNAILV
jgi:hypothetical protein